jgi:hypothetical protein
MVVGFNHNVKYRGDIFHIQTEDSGLANPHIITLLYRGGTILASKKTSYADIIKMENLEKVVEELMKEQHKAMLRNLKAGLFDERAFGASPAGTADAPAKTSVTDKPAEVIPTTPLPPVPTPPASTGAGKAIQSLDEVILDYLVRGEDL